MEGMNPILGFTLYPNLYFPLLFISQWLEVGGVVSWRQQCLALSNSSFHNPRVGRNLSHWEGTHAQTKYPKISQLIKVLAVQKMRRFAFLIFRNC